MPSKLLPTIGAEWRTKVLHDLPWKPTAEERPGGEAEGFFVACGELRGYLKPSKADAQIATHPRAAHEKIAADLAFDLGLPVPPAILVDGIRCQGLVRAAVVTLVLFPEVQKWEHAVATQQSSAIAHAVLRSTRAMWSGIVAFDTWLANSDRANATNLLIGTDPHNSPQLSEPIFCDYANSMIHSQWTLSGHQDVAVPSQLSAVQDSVDRKVALSVADKIRVITEQQINEIVQRIPEEYLKDNQKAIIVEGLCVRRGKVPDAIAARFQ